MFNFEEIDGKFNEYELSFIVNNKKYVLTQTTNPKDIIKYRYKFVPSGAKITTDGNDNMEINWDGKPVYMKDIYCKGNIETEGVLHFKSHKYGHDYLLGANISRRSIYSGYTSGNNSKGYLVNNPYIGLINVD